MEQMKTDPKVSVIIPVYNGAKYLKEAIDSALSQKYKNKEVIVVNDGSTDGGATAKVAKSFKSKIIYIEKENGGVSTALNLGIARMKGELFAWLSHDDAFMPEKISQQVEKFNEPGIGLCYTDYYLMDAAGQVFQTVESPYYAPKDFLREQLVMNKINGCTVMIRKTVLETNPFNTSRRYCQDGDLWVRLLRKGIIFSKVSEPLTKYRVHAEADSQTAARKQSEDIAEMYRGLAQSLRPEEVFSGLEGVNATVPNQCQFKLWLGQTVRESWSLYQVEREILMQLIRESPLSSKEAILNLAISYPRQLTKWLRNRISKRHAAWKIP
jgi:glycosyltransferase involved in cell wall biosynthesis